VVAAQKAPRRRMKPPQPSTRRPGHRRMYCESWSQASIAKTSMVWVPRSRRRLRGTSQPRAGLSIAAAVDVDARAHHRVLIVLDQPLPAPTRGCCRWRPAPRHRRRVMIATDRRLGSEACRSARIVAGFADRADHVGDMVRAFLAPASRQDVVMPRTASGGSDRSSRHR